MFKSDIRLYGKHAAYLKTYSKDKQGETQFLFTLKDNENNSKDVYIFETMIQCYMAAAMIGIIEGKTAPEDTSNRSLYSNIMTEQVVNNRSILKRITQFMILSTEGGTADKRIKRAFSVNREDDKEIEKLVSSYARGGLEVINEIFESCRTYEDAANQILHIIDKYGIEETN